ncbi:MAG: hypothetical protein QOD99_805 [Chthoniobacter sp.]|jgi:hypothetical protein|nr:hypothetical protein [Chthoniobacter sp.]
MSERQKTFIALSASAILHALMCISLIAWAWLRPMKMRQAVPDFSQLEVTLMPAGTSPPPPAVAATTVPPMVAPTPPPKVTRSTLDADGLEATDMAPAKPLFESDINSRAASELPGLGSLPLPSQEGKQREFEQFKTQEFSLGKGAQPAQAKLDPAGRPAPVEASPPAPKPMPSAAPKEQAVPQSTPRPTPFFTPTPAPTSTPAIANALALGKPTPVPSVPPPPTPVQSATPAPQLAKLVPTPALRGHTEAPPTTPREPGYQPQREQTKIEGGISNKGRPGVDAVATPLGRYKKSIADAIGSRWYFYINNRMDLITVGDVHIKFYVNEAGHPEDVKILSNTANDTFGNYCIQSVTEAKIPALPPDVASALVNGRLEIDYHFTIYPQ